MRKLSVFLLALGISILLQTIERFLSPVAIEDPKLILIVGGVGLVLNALSAVVLGGTARVDTIFFLASQPFL